jgi:hypothetical protein
MYAAKIMIIFLFFVYKEFKRERFFINVKRFNQIS